MNDRWFIHDSFTMSFIKKKKKKKKVEEDDVHPIKNDVYMID